ncbi:hypothetical protein H0X10_00585 [Candidatus Saccharibacteria bacterium]|nr:hypothetical protein [Candidatus Saccharibacteria bacterium]
MITENHLKSFFKDRQGNTVVWQWPNIPLYGWIIFKLLAWAIPDFNIQNGLEQLSTAFLFTWAYLEITKGATYFRKILGLLVLILIFNNVLFN